MPATARGKRSRVGFTTSSSAPSTADSAALSVRTPSDRSPNPLRDSPAGLGPVARRPSDGRQNSAPSPPDGVRADALLSRDGSVRLPLEDLPCHRSQRLIGKVGELEKSFLPVRPV